MLPGKCTQHGSLQRAPGGRGAGGAARLAAQGPLGISPPLPSLGLRLYTHCILHAPYVCIYRASQKEADSKQYNPNPIPPTFASPLYIQAHFYIKRGGYMFVQDPHNLSTHRVQCFQNLGLGTTSRFLWCFVKSLKYLKTLQVPLPCLQNETTCY